MDEPITTFPVSSTSADQSITGGAQVSSTVGEQATYNRAKRQENLPPPILLPLPNPPFRSTNRSLPTEIKSKDPNLDYQALAWLYYGTEAVTAACRRNSPHHIITVKRLSV